MGKSTRRSETKLQSKRSEMKHWVAERSRFKEVDAFLHSGVFLLTLSTVALAFFPCSSYVCIHIQDKTVRCSILRQPSAGLSQHVPVSLRKRAKTTLVTSHKRKKVLRLQFCRETRRTRSLWQCDFLISELAQWRVWAHEILLFYSWHWMWAFQCSFLDALI